MTTVVNTPATSSEESSSTGVLVAVILILFFGILFFIYGIPMLRRSVPSTQINVPDKIDVNVQQSQPTQ